MYTKAGSVYALLVFLDTGQLYRHCRWAVHYSKRLGGLPGWLFSGAAEFVSEAGKVTDISVEMQQRVREMTLELTVAEGNTNLIERITISAADNTIVKGAMVMIN